MLTPQTAGDRADWRRGGHRVSFLPASLAFLAVCAACDAGGEGGVRPVRETREVELVGDAFRWNASTAERFRLRAPTEGAGGHAGGGEAPSLTWETPPGWGELPASSLRQANFQVAGDESAECYLTILSGDGGGLVANVNRWRKQLSLPDVGADEVASLPRAEFLGGEGLLVDLRGTWTGMGGDELGEDYRMLGLLRVDADSAAFLKMVGPSGVIDGEVEAFRALARSFHGGPGHDPSHQHGTSPATAPSRSASGLSWTAPENWKRGPDRAMRDVTYFMGAEDSGECYVAVLGGDAGGISANINRWRNQMGQEPLSTTELGALQRTPMLGTEGVVVEIDGSFEGMAGESVTDARMLGAVCLLSDRAVFVKAIGPRSVIEEEREAFLRFCESLDRAR